MVSVVILAAGAGTRMKSETPKVLHTLCGRSMVALSIDQALKLSDDIHIVLFHQAERIEQHLSEEFQSLVGQKIFFHTQDYVNFPGTGGALRGISTKYNRILVLNSDMPLIQAQSLQILIKNPHQIVMSVLFLDDPNGYGRVILDSHQSENAQNRVLRIVEQKDASREELAIKSVNAGVYIFDKEVLTRYLPLLENNNVQKEYYLTDVIALARKDEVEIAALKADAQEYMGVNTKAHLAQAQEILLEHLRFAAMENGVIMDMPHTIYLEPGVEFRGECRIENGVRLSGKCIIESSHIKAHSIIESSVIIKSDIGPMAHIRPNSKITNTHIGNFVEVKASSLEGVKAGHLSYLGDSEIKNGTNIGAGVITCNYDGKSKHKTFIGENVFVGSDTQLVAPLKIESNVLIAAGSSIVKDIPQGALAISRQRQSNKLGFFYKFFNKGQENA
ncbi:MAG: bifunctional UDP-N-acetylglucosamine diphosphorylase/glucosamine-1-phosphate N-acetyltransferase GlmU [Helicobacter sp.]|uniref:bifunctional UDP-N-acetylglucosamine diphosphorylase/glucosamine-1-phosphate N-acetyltransferase GlmU n=1 Tax=Helicobacter sp. 10-6591 TaxID=2004998 RepID=UPI000DCE98BE|nr:bifunctional UDP-N-acetylglucosamine diphosphorylase/glucosamine-1-phosphate N-acetyltransferase GlmU [Helicobacter sp. 10-6591]MCI6218261.1 bifunctional UDP-N-acetylglucosamine diphosphorylase/glucosamine-1-phosphate N-acetyltransferase GlmU [Helicobacter sp.]MCI7484956.1 bifunctional UDP-N-acetylglucosamine diphosphorylase/glucosamine-1-phosphate N-acetyltransferase GlmU [Helicobacter sp.]MDD7568213.1 bifunctional UDP-N-acetylglucosamine diphosphorylase/glucosamine-1-phosphate N-acetyltrans